jgi:hypothetical protein
MFSDVQLFFTEIIPRLQPGVVIHIHDIPFPAHAWFNRRVDPRQKPTWKPYGASATSLAKFKVSHTMHVLWIVVFLENPLAYAKDQRMTCCPRIRTGPRDYTEQFMLHALMAFNPFLEVVHFGGVFAEGWADAMSWGSGKLGYYQKEAAKIILPTMGGTSHTQTPFANGGSVYIRRTTLPYPRELDPLISSPGLGLSMAQRDALPMEDFLSSKRTWVGWSHAPEPLTLGSSLSAGAGGASEAQELAVQALLDRYSPEAEDSIQRVLLIGSSSLSKAVTSHMRRIVHRANAVHSSTTAGETRFEDFMALGAGDMLVYSMRPDDLKASRDHPDVIMFVIEVLPRLAPGVVVVLRGVPFPLANDVPKSGPKQSSNVAQFVVQAFGIHNSEFEILWAEGTYDGPAARAPPSEQCLIIHRRLEKVNWGQNFKV